MTDCFVRTVKEEGMKALFKVSWLVIVSDALCGSVQPSAEGVLQSSCLPVDPQRTGCPAAAL